MRATSRCAGDELRLHIQITWGFGNPVMTLGNALVGSESPEPKPLLTTAATPSQYYATVTTSLQ
jgi:hypothetical protein